MATYVNVPTQIPAELAEELHRLEPLFAVAREFYALGVRLHPALDREERTSLQTVAYLIYGKAFRTFQSVLNLCLCGCGVDALSLCGSLFENLVDLKYMRKAPVRRPLRYIQFEQVEKVYQAEKILAHKRLPRGMRSRYRSYLAGLRAQAGALTRHFPKRGLGWAQLTTKQRAKSAGMEIEYEELYWIFCGYKHTLPAAAHGLMVDDEPQRDVAVGPNAGGVFEALVHALRYGLQVFASASEAHGLNLEAEVDRIGRAFMTACDAVGPARH